MGESKIGEPTIQALIDGWARLTVISYVYLDGLHPSSGTGRIKIICSSSQGENFIIYITNKFPDQIYRIASELPVEAFRANFFNELLNRIKWEVMI